MADSDFGFTEKESKLMASAWLCFEEKPKIDFIKLASLNGYTNPRSATNAWSSIKKKLAAQEAKTATASGSGSASASGGDGETLKPIKPKATPRKRGKKAADEDGAGDDDESPAKKVKSTPRKRAPTPKAKAAQQGSDDDDEIVKAEQSDEDVMV